MRRKLAYKRVGLDLPPRVSTLGLLWKKGETNPMPERVPLSERAKEALRQLFIDATGGDVESELVRHRETS